MQNRGDGHDRAQVPGLLLRVSFTGTASSSLIFLIFVVAACGPRNHAPEVPTLWTGPSYGLPESSYTFSASATDPDGDSIAIETDWGDSTPLRTSGYMPSGETLTLPHSWRKSRSFSIRSRARDKRGLFSDWSVGHSLRIVNADSLPVPPSLLAGPDSVTANSIADFLWALNGPPGEHLDLEVYWGDSNDVYLDTTLMAGDTLRLRYAYYTPGTHRVKARVYDVRHGESGWSPDHVLEVKAMSGHGWERSYGDWYPYSVIRADDGGCVFTGEADTGLTLAKTDAAGNLLWMRSYVDTTGYWTYGVSVRQTANRGYIIVGQTPGPFGALGIYLTRTDANGYLVWQRGYYKDEPEYGNTVACCIRPTPDGGYVIAADDLLMKTDSAGDSVWTKPYPAGTIQVTPDGGYIICGGMSDSTLLTKTDAQGVVQWQRVYPGDRNFRTVQLTGDGGYVVAGDAGTNGVPLAYLAKLDGAGSVVWEKRFEGLGEVETYDLALASDGGCYLLGWTEEPEIGGSQYLLRTDQNGNRIWERVWGMLEDDEGYAVAATPDDGCLIAGSNGDGAALFKVAPQGGSGPTLGRVGRSHSVIGKRSRGCALHARRRLLR